jgi:indolepyruvate ferredoxin oxidoreductase beta subunit
MEALRYLPYLRRGGAVVSHTLPFVNIPDYPDEAGLLDEVRRIEKHCLIDAVALAKEVGSIRCANMVMLGAGSPFLGLDREALLFGIRNVFASKRPDVIETNVRGFLLGLSRAGED